MNQRDARRLAAVFLLCIVAGCASFWIARWMARRSQNEPVVVNPTPTQTRPRRVVTRPSLAPVFTPTPSKTDSVALALQKLDKAALLEHAQHLSGSIGPRLAGTRAERRAADYIEAQFRAYGYAPQREDFITKKGGRSCNVIARRALPGQRQIVVGAHFDSVRVAPGANDNASGVAVLLELARVLANEKTPVRFIAFGAEERWEKQYLVKAHRLNGSNQHVSGLGDEKRLIKAMISLDMVGFGSVLQIGTLPGSGAGSKKLAQALETQARALKLPVEKFQTPPWSDHVAFARAGVPAVWVWWCRDRLFHTARDGVQRVNPEKMRAVARVLLRYLMTNN